LGFSLSQRILLRFPGIFGAIGLKLVKLIRGLLLPSIEDRFAAKRKYHNVLFQRKR